MILGYFFLVSFYLTILSYQVDAQACTLNCGANGACSIGTNGAQTCVCKPNYLGSLCQYYDPCVFKPCGSNGACLSYFTATNAITYHCQCYFGWSGINCQTAAPSPCMSNPCLNGGVCSIKPNTWDYQCACPSQYSGYNCGTYNDPCVNNKCLNSATCRPGNVLGNYTCSCLTGFDGTFCEHEIDECKVTVNGKLTDVCKNNATCLDLIDGYICQCVGQWAGINCEIPLNPCDPNPCGTGSVCTPNGGTYTCSCRPDYFGKPCQPNPCYTNPCGTRTCIPIEAGALNFNIPGCSATSNTSPTYVCLCPNSSPLYASNNC